MFAAAAPPASRPAGGLADTGALLARVRRAALPGGEDAARRVRAVRLTELGEMRSGWDDPWMAVTAEETIEAQESAFRREARVVTGPYRSLVMTDAYEGGHGQLQLHTDGEVPLLSVQGPRADKGEIQRYLRHAACCPAMTVAHPTLQWDALDAATLRLRDRMDPTGASVELRVARSGLISECHAVRPRVVDDDTIDTPWSATFAEARVFEGLRIPTWIESSWHLREGTFTYHRVKILSVSILR
jgi:hypothetical protein